MNQTVRILQKYLVIALPFVLLCMGWSTYRNEQQIMEAASPFLKIIWEVLALNLMLWFAMLIVFLGLIVVSSNVREKTLKRLANLKERDEREQYITGRASRTAYISTMGILVFLLFFSIFSLNIYRAPQSEAVNGKTGAVAIGVGFSLLDKPRVEVSPQTGQVLFESKDIPLSKTAILLTLLIWQLVSFNLAARRETLRSS